MWLATDKYIDTHRDRHMGIASHQNVTVLSTVTQNGLTDSPWNDHYHHHQFLTREDRWGTTDDFPTSFLNFSLFSTAFWDLTNSGLSIP